MSQIKVNITIGLPLTNFLILSSLELNITELEVSTLIIEFCLSLSSMCLIMWNRRIWSFLTVKTSLKHKKKNLQRKSVSPEYFSIVTITILLEENRTIFFSCNMCYCTKSGFPATGNQGKP